MPKINVIVPHQLNQQNAVERVKPVIHTLLEAFNGENINVNWTESKADFDCKSLGFAIKGNADVQAAQVVTTIELPFAAMMFKGKVEQAINKYITRAVG